MTIRHSCAFTYRGNQSLLGVRAEVMGQDVQEADVPPACLKNLGRTCATGVLSRIRPRPTIASRLLDLRAAALPAPSRRLSTPDGHIHSASARQVRPGLEVRSVGRQDLTANARC